MKLEHTRPFNWEHARAGAPFCCASGEKVEVLTWDRKSNLSIVGIVDNSTQEVMGWNTEGTNANGTGFHLVMTPLGFIDGKPVFVGDKLVEKADGSPVTVGEQWVSMNPDLWSWPSPAPVYPETRLSHPELSLAALNANSAPMHVSASQLHAIANAALRHAIDAGQVVRKDDHALAIADAHRAGHEAYRTEYAVAARELAIAEAVHHAHINGRHTIQGAFDLDLVALIATVK